MPSKDTHTWPMLFKRTSAGKVQEWQISVTANPDGSATITTVQGQQGGKKQTYDDVVKEGKNVGKKNETTPYEQAFNEAEAKWTKQRDRRHYGLTVDESAAKRAIAPMLAHKFEDHVKKVDWNQAIAQPKFDGHRCLVFIEADAVKLYSRKGEEIASCDHIVEVLNPLRKRHAGMILDGELYVHDLELRKIGSLIRRKQADSERLRFLSYDLAADEPYQQRLDDLETLFKRYNFEDIVDLARSEPVSNEDALMDFQGQCIEDGYEGAILRWGRVGYEAGKRSQSLLKVKTFHDDEFPVVGVKEGRGTFAGMAILVCKTNVGHKFEVTAPGTHDEKREVWKNRDKYLGQRVTVKYQCYTTTDTPVPFHPVAKAFV